MHWYRYLYTDESIVRKKDKIIWKVNHNVGQPNIYLITLPAGDKNLLEIIPAVQLLQKAYPKKRLFVVGIAKGSERAAELASSIVLEVYRETGDFHVKKYLLRNHRMGEPMSETADADDAQVSACP